MLSGRREQVAREAQSGFTSSSRLAGPLEWAALLDSLCYIRVIALVKYVINHERLFF